MLSSWLCTSEHCPQSRAGQDWPKIRGHRCPGFRLCHCTGSILNLKWPIFTPLALAHLLGMILKPLWLESRTSRNTSRVGVGFLQSVSVGIIGVISVDYIFLLLCPYPAKLLVVTFWPSTTNRPPKIDLVSIGPNGWVAGGSRGPW